MFKETCFYLEFRYIKPDGKPVFVLTVCRGQSLTGFFKLKTTYKADTRCPMRNVNSQRAAHWMSDDHRRSMLNNIFVERNHVFSQILDAQARLVFAMRSFFWVKKSYFWHKMPRKLASTTCLEKTGWWTGFYSWALNLDRFLRTGFFRAIFQTGRQNRVKKRISDRFLDRTGKTLFSRKTCHRTCFLFLTLFGLPVWKTAQKKTFSEKPV